MRTLSLCVLFVCELFLYISFFLVFVLGVSMLKKVFLKVFLLFSYVYMTCLYCLINSVSCFS